MFIRDRGDTHGFDMVTDNFDLLSVHRVESGGRFFEFFWFLPQRLRPSLTHRHDTSALFIWIIWSEISRGGSCSLRFWNSRIRPIPLHIFCLKIKVIFAPGFVFLGMRSDLQFPYFSIEIIEIDTFWGLDSKMAVVPVENVPGRLSSFLTRYCHCQLSFFDWVPWQVESSELLYFTHNRLFKFENLIIMRNFLQIYMFIIANSRLFIKHRP